MRPVLFHAGPVAVHSWGVMAALAFVAAGYVLRLELQRRGARGDSAYALTLAAAVGGVVGARVYWLAEHAGSASVTDSLSGAGFTWYGGVIGAAGAMLLIARSKHLDVTALLASSAPALALGYAIGRIGCQLAGDGTYGSASDLPWAMSYPHGEVPTSQRVHPTPVYETLASLLIFALLWRLRERLSAIRLFALYLLLAGGEQQPRRVHPPQPAGSARPHAAAAVRRRDVRRRARAARLATRVAGTHGASRALIGPRTTPSIYYGT